MQKKPFKKKQDFFSIIIDQQRKRLYNK
ncbi:hypothetical protein B14911_21693 [Bacillus sp. NRRL B-14911]|nr:hypothetical protein B14911_21693 [Bacillus sp. NRRL B-14911]